MASSKHNEFHERLRNVERNHKRLNSGYVRLEERNGLLVPVQKVRTRVGFPWRGLFLVLMVFWLFKAFLLAYVGPLDFVDQHAKLETGTLVERMGAWIMRADPVTVYLSEQIAPVLKTVKQALRLEG